MSKKIHTIQSSDKKEFDKEVNLILELGGELIDGGYQVINSDDGVVYSQVIVFKKNCEVEFYDNGQLKFVKNKNEYGKEDGLWTDWYDNGVIRESGVYIEGERNDDWNFSSPDGKENGKIEYFGGNRVHGHYFIYWDNGNKMVDEFWIKGKKDGKWISWYENGNLEKIKNYCVDKLNGEFIQYSKSGQILQESFFENGKPIGTSINYHKDGRIKTKIVRDGDNEVWTDYIYDSSGKLINTESHDRFGRLYKYTYFYPDGNKKQKTQYTRSRGDSLLDKQPSGKWFWYDQEGTIIKVEDHDKE